MALFVAYLPMCSVAWSDIRVAPFFSLREEYNDNIDLEYKAKSDFITLATAGLAIGWEARFFELDLHLGLEYEKYLEYSEKDDLRPSQGTRLESLFNLYRDIVFLRISDTYERVAIDEGNKGGIGNNLTNLTDSNRLEINPFMLLDLTSTLQFRLDYLYQNLWYDKAEGDDAEFHRYSTTLTKALTPHISASVNGGFTQYRPKDPFDPFSNDTGAERYDRRDIGVGLYWQPLEQLVFGANYGRAWLDYAFSNDYDTNLMGIRMDYQLSRIHWLALAYQEGITASVKDGARKQKEYSCALGYHDRILATIELFSRREDYLERKRSDDVWGGSFSAEVPLSAKYGVRTLLRYADYEEDSPIYAEEHQRYGALVALYRELRVGRASLGYTYNRNDSNHKLENYTNNIIYVQLALHW
ncbi:MAG: hypothetical protein PHH87_02310 [Desulfuromonas sp.]|nr:hypothetical protein [Desulfuromonas sp.]